MITFIIGCLFCSFCFFAAERLPHQLKWRDEPESLTLLSRPFCDHCKNPINIKYLIPIVGYLFTKGRCRSCKLKIPHLYWIAEISVGLFTLFLVAYFGIHLQTLLIVTLFFSLLLLSIIDIKESWLPATITFPLFWMGLICSPFADEPMMRIYGACFGFFLLYFAMYLVSKLRHEDVFAGGDIALASVAGAWLGVEQMPYYIILSNLCFIAYALPSRMKGNVFMPMGPALSFGFLVCFYI